LAKSAIQTFGKYQILERIATGGMAEIYKARLEGIGGFQRTFAIKRILPNLSQNSSYIAMLVDEAKVAGLLSHANIVQILDLGQVDNIWYIAMEYVHGRDLGRVLRRARKKGLCLPVPHAVFIAIELLKGLEYAHNRQVMRGGRPVALNIIHRDVSPPNVLLSFQGEVKLTDFGIARASLKAMETVSGIIRGRFDYMSPEQAGGRRDLDQRSDLFSVGVVLYEALTGVHPFRAENEIGTVERVRKGRFSAVSEHNPEVPYTLEEVVARALSVDRDVRYPSATAFKEALDKFFHDSGFIFTHGTLASYVQGLFPEAEHQRKRRPAALTDELDLEESDQPTRRLDDALIRDAAALNRGSSGGAVDGDGPTKIRRNPLLGQRDTSTEPATLVGREWEDEVATVVRSASSLDDQQTLIRKNPLDELMGDPTPMFEPRIDEEVSDVALPEPDIILTPKAPVQRMGLGVGGVVAAGFSVLAGLMVGIALTTTVFVVLGAQLLQRNAPVVRVIAPADTSVLLNGDAVGSEFTVVAGEPQKVEIILRDHGAWEREIVLQPGEVHEVVIVQR
jgi:serine/threonine protein kinase